MSDTVYANPKYRDVDVGAIMRDGHPDIAEGDERIVATVRKLRGDRGGRLRILDVGSGSGDLSLLLARALPDCEVIANDIAPNPIAQAREKLASFPHSSVFAEAFEEWREKVDVVISWGSHHHLAHDYLEHVHRILSSGGIFIVGDEFCPEYLSPADKERLAAATQITLVDGYVFDNAADVSTYKATGRAHRMEPASGASTPRDVVDVVQIRRRLRHRAQRLACAHRRAGDRPRRLHHRLRRRAQDVAVPAGTRASAERVQRRGTDRHR